MQLRTKLLFLVLLEWAIAVTAALYARKSAHDAANFDEAVADCEKVLVLIGQDPEKKKDRDMCKRVVDTAPARADRARSQEKAWTYCAIAFLIGGAGVVALRARKTNA